MIANSNYFTSVFLADFKIDYLNLIFNANHLANFDILLIQGLPDFLISTITSKTSSYNLKKSLSLIGNLLQET